MHHSHFAVLLNLIVSWSSQIAKSENWNSFLEKVVITWLGGRVCALRPSSRLLLVHQPLKMPTPGTLAVAPGGIKSYYQAKIESAENLINQKTQNLRRLEAQRNALNTRGESFSSPWNHQCSRCWPNSIVRLLREELQLLHEPGSYVGEVVKVMGKTKVLVKVQPEGKYSMFPWIVLYFIKSSYNNPH